MIVSHQSKYMCVQGYVKTCLEKDKAQPRAVDPSRRDMAVIIRKIKDQMKHVWNDTQNFGVSQEVFMVEVEVIHRLYGDGVIPKTLCT
jgi:hypothetical protein